ncbi:MAG TPA: NAD(+)/NADH kinase [Firmicutes bacterium]|nr:NAD(+)/NADH kinase [Bacillota bacterium]HHY97307.1 NAD(+)/NADH kinase [Bacillota bacterium]
MTKIGLIPHLGKKDALSTTRKLMEWISEMGGQALVDPQTAEFFGMRELSFGTKDVGKKIDLAIVLGGDGALLAASRDLAGTGVPILGVNVGHLGFLTEVDLSGLKDALSKLLSGRYSVEDRMMLEAGVIRDGEEIERFIGLNDAVITKGAFARMIRLETYIDAHYIGTYPADGVIVATPTGSTAYSLSAGGPIVNPCVRTLIVTFICPHTLFARSIVAAEDESVRVVVSATHEEVMLTMDGQVGFKLANKDEVVVRRAAAITKLVRLGEWNFYEVLRARLAEGRV